MRSKSKKWKANDHDRHFSMTVKKVAFSMSSLLGAGLAHSEIGWLATKAAPAYPDSSGQTGRSDGSSIGARFVPRIIGRTVRRGSTASLTFGLPDLE